MNAQWQRVAIVTGAAAGIGKGIALTLACNGYAVFLFDKNEEALVRVCKEEFMQYKVDYFVGDVTSRKEVDAALQQCIQTFGRMDVLVANAGMIEKAEFLAMTEQQWDNTMNINIKGVFLWGQAVAKWMVENKIAGSIVNIGCMRASLVCPTMSAYATAKAGVRMLTKSMALELAPYQINVNVIEPGRTQTAGLKQYIQTNQDESERLALIPLGRFATPEDIGQTVLFLVSAQANYITGAVIPVDGGYSIAKK